MKKKNYHHGNLKQELLDFAFDFIHKHDIDSLTLKVLADATNTSRTAIYKHFSSKNELIKAIMEKGFNEFDNVLVPILSNKDEPIHTRLHLAAKHYIQWARSNPNLYRLMFGHKYAYIRESFVTIRSENCKGFAALKSLLEYHSTQNSINNYDGFMQAVMIWASLHGLASLIIDCFEDVEDIYETLLLNILDQLSIMN